MLLIIRVVLNNYMLNIVSHIQVVLDRISFFLRPSLVP